MATEKNKQPNQSQVTLKNYIEKLRDNQVNISLKIKAISFFDILRYVGLKKNPIAIRGSPHSEVANMQDCDIVVSQFELQSNYHVPFWTTLGKYMNPLSF